MFSKLIADKSQNTQNPNKDYEVTSPPEDSVGCLSFGPAALQKNFLVAGSWDNQIRLWEIEPNATTIPKSMQTLTAPPLDASWSDDGKKIYIACSDNQAKVWDLISNQVIQIAIHDSAVSSCNWIKTPTYSCLMTTSWDKTVKFWDTRTPTPLLTMNHPTKIVTAKVDYPVAVVTTILKKVYIYTLEHQPKEVKSMDTLLKTQHRCITIFRDKNSKPDGFAIGSAEGRSAIHYFDPKLSKDFTFKCHRVPQPSGNIHDIYMVNDIVTHPVHRTLASVGSDGSFSFWDKDCKSRLCMSKRMEQPITKCSFNYNGQIFAYAVGYDWSRGHEFANSGKKNCIFLRPCFDETRPKNG